MKSLMKTGDNITIKSLEEIKILSDAGKILADIINALKSSLKAGITTKGIDQQAEQLIHQYNVQPAFKGYRGFPACACVSVNEQVVHGIPSQRVIRDGDIVSLDVGIIHRNYYADTAVTVPVGTIPSSWQNLLDVTYASLYKGIEQARVDQHLSDISHAIQRYVEDNHLSIVRDFVGHGIGRHLHEEPEIPNFGEPHQGPLLKAGMVFAIEPMVNLGTWHTRILEDGWTVVTQDGKPSAHFEHTIAITENGARILT